MSISMELCSRECRFLLLEEKHSVDASKSDTLDVGEAQNVANEASAPPIATVAPLRICCEA
jgi:hypothetical protein